MIKIHSQNTQLLINDEGCISEDISKLSGVRYPVFLKDYSRMDPTCRLLDISKPIYNVQSTLTQSVFDKIIEDIHTRHTIQIQETGWDWTIDVLSPNPGYQFGISIPMPSGLVMDIEQSQIFTSTAKYPINNKVFADQTRLNLPLVYVNFQEKTYGIFTSTISDCDFFIYSENGNQYIRVTHFTSLSTKILVHFRICNNISELINDYNSIEKIKMDSVEYARVKQDNIDPIDVANNIFQKLQSGELKDATVWMDFMRTCRQPHVMWEIGYIQPQPILKKINKMIRDAEKILFENNTSVLLKNDLCADVNQQAAFNTIRAYLQAEDSHYEEAVNILSNTMTHMFDQLSIIRQSNLLYHNCVATLCCNMLEESYNILEQHYQLIMHVPESQRWSDGLWDNQIILHLIFWFFSQHNLEIRRFLSTKHKTIPESIWNHKKTSLLQLLSNDHSWIVSSCSLPFYNHACSIFGLPPYTPRGL